MSTYDSSMEAITDKDGFYSFEEKPFKVIIGDDKVKVRCIMPNTRYAIIISKEGYLESGGEESTKGIDVSTTFVHDFALTPIK